MAMRLYTRTEFEKELRTKWKLEPTEHQAAMFTIWKTPKGKHVMVPTLPKGTRYPDFYVDEIVEQLKRLDEYPAPKS